MIPTLDALVKAANLGLWAELHNFCAWCREYADVVMSQKGEAGICIPCCSKLAALAASSSREGNQTEQLGAYNRKT